MLGRVGTIAAIVQSQRRFPRAGVIVVSGMTMAVGGVVGSCGCRTPAHCDPLRSSSSSSSSSSWGNNNVNILIPTLEASVRVLRLLRTAVLMVMDYEVAKYKPKLLDTNNKKADLELDALEGSMEVKQRELESAQIAYARGSTDSDGMSPDDRRTLKENQKRIMQQAATELAEMEKKLGTMEGVSAKSQLHRKAAHRLLDLCRQNGGVYIKVGQHLANLDYLIPQEYTEVLSSLFDDTPRSSYGDVCKVIEEELGGQVQEIFDRFDKEPIASASLAQVHVAYDKKTGKKLAVKVQHRGLRETSVGDIFAVTKVVGVIDRLFENFTFGWIADEIAPHLPKELDFTREGRNAEKAASNIAKTGLPCVIPKVIWSKTAPRVLTMEFEEGFKVTDAAAIEKSGLNKHDISKLVSSVFNSQVFLSGWVHCDPHPANVLLRSKNGKPEMVLVDHGLYKDIDDTFRVRYARLWRSLMVADLQEIQASCHDIGVDRAFPLFAAILTARPYDEIMERSRTGSFGATEATPDSQADRAVIRGYAKEFMKDIIVLLGTLPPQMLLLLKMNDCLRHIDFALGSPTNTLVTAGKYASKAVYDEKRKVSSMQGRVSAWMQYMKVLFRIQIYDFGIWIRRSLSSTTITIKNS